MDTVLNVQAGQQIVFVWKIGGRECPFIHFTDPKLVKSYSDYSLIEQDLLAAQECFTQLIEIETKNHTVLNSLFSNAIISYGRCFTEAEARSAILDPNQVYSGLSVERQIHEWMMNLRHRFFAHSGGTEFETVMVYLAVNPDQKTGPEEIYRGLVRASSLEEEKNREALIAIKSALNWVGNKIEKSRLRMRELLAQEDIGNLYGQSRLPESLDSSVLRINVEQSSFSHVSLKPWVRV